MISRKMESRFVFAPLGYVCNITLGKMLQSGQASTTDKLHPYLKARNVTLLGLNLDDLDLMWASPSERHALNVQPGDLIVSEGGDAGRSAIVPEAIPEHTIFQNSVHRVRARGGNCTRFFKYALEFIYDSGYLDVLCNKATIAHLTKEKLSSIRVPFPSPEEQLEIATYLDRKIAKFDRLIAQCQEMDRVVRTRVESFITASVTKGVRPTPVLSDSGSDFLGLVPKHWTVLRNKVIFRLFNGHAFDGDFFSSSAIEYPKLVTPGNFNPGGGLYFGNENTTYYLGATSRRYILPAGSQVIVMTDLSYKKLILGRCETVRESGLLLNQRVGRVIVNRNQWTAGLDARFLEYVLNSHAVRQQVICTARGSTVFHTSPQKIGNCIVALPPDAEQKEIVAALDQQTLPMRKIIDRCSAIISVVRARRSAIIANAVLGITAVP